MERILGTMLESTQDNRVKANKWIDAQDRLLEALEELKKLSPEFDAPHAKKALVKVATEYLKSL